MELEKKKISEDESSGLRSDSKGGLGGTISGPIPKTVPLEFFRETPQEKVVVKEVTTITENKSEKLLPTPPPKELKLIVIDGFQYKEKSPPRFKSINIKTITKDRVLRTENEKCLICSTFVDTIEKAIVRFKCAHWCCLDCVLPNKNFSCPKCNGPLGKRNGELQIDIGEKSSSTSQEIKKLFGRQGIRKNYIKELSFSQTIWLKRKGFKSNPSQRQTNILDLEGVSMNSLLDERFSLNQIHKILLVNSAESLIKLGLNPGHLMLKKEIFVENVGELLDYGINREFMISFMKQRNFRPSFISKETMQKREIGLTERLHRSGYDLGELIDLGWTFKDLISDGTPHLRIETMIRECIGPITSWRELKENLKIEDIHMRNFPFLMVIEKENPQEKKVKDQQHHQQHPPRVIQGVLPGKQTKKVIFKVNDSFIKPSPSFHYYSN